jgi:hypothetical protein
MKKIIQLTFAILLANITLTFGQTNSSVLNGPINVYPPTGDWTSSLNLFNPTKTNQFHITHDAIGTLKFGYDGSGKMTLLGNGNLGIGTYSPSSRLTLADVAPSLRFEANANAGYFVELKAIENGAERFSLNVGGDYILGHKVIRNDGQAHTYLSGRQGIGFATEVGVPSATGAGVKMFIAPNGYVGIGTLTPSNTLTIDSKLNAKSGLTFTGFTKKIDGTSFAPDLVRNLGVNSLGEVVAIDGAVGGSGDIWTKSGDNTYRNLGNVGIGTATPSTKLEVNSAEVDVSIFKGTNGAAAFRFYNDINKGITLSTYKSDYPATQGSPYGVGANGSIVVQTANAPMAIGTWEVAQPLLFGTGSIERMRILANGNVGIGTNDPQYKLQVVVPKATTQVYSGSFRIIDGAKNPGLFISNEETTGITSLDFSGTTGYQGRFRVGGVDVISMLNNGNVGIGTTAPSHKLSVNGDALVGQESNGSGIIIRNNQAGVFKNDFLVAGKTDHTYLGNYQSLPIGIYTGNVERMRISADGNVTIGTTLTPAGYKLAIGGDIIAERVVVKLQANWPDYVFTPSYERATLPEIEKYINQNHHLPNIPSAQEVSDKGIDVGAMNTKMMEKIEELTLYLIEQNKKLEALEKKNTELENAIKSIKK